MWNSQPKKRTGLLACRVGTLEVRYFISTYAHRLLEGAPPRRDSIAAEKSRSRCAACRLSFSLSCKGCTGYLFRLGLSWNPRDSPHAQYRRIPPPPGPSRQPGRPSEPAPTDGTAQHPGPRPRITPSCWPALAFLQLVCSCAFLGSLVGYLLDTYWILGETFAYCYEVSNSATHDTLRDESGRSSGQKSKEQRSSWGRGLPATAWRADMASWRQHTARRATSEPSL